MLSTKLPKRGLPEIITYAEAFGGGISMCDLVFEKQLHYYDVKRLASLSGDGYIGTIRIALDSEIWCYAASGYSGNIHPSELEQIVDKLHELNHPPSDPDPPKEQSIYLERVLDAIRSGALEEEVHGGTTKFGDSLIQFSGVINGLNVAAHVAQIISKPSFSFVVRIDGEYILNTDVPPYVQELLDERSAKASGKAKEWKLGLLEIAFPTEEAPDVRTDP